MPRTADDPARDPFPLGAPLQRKRAGADAAKPGWRPLPGHPGIEVNERGQWRTNLPLPQPGKR